MKNLSKYLMLPLLVVACGSGLSISVYRGNHEKASIERKVRDKNGRAGVQFVPANDPRFDQFQCLADSEMWKVQELYNRAKRAGVKTDDL